MFIGPAFHIILLVLHNPCFLINYIIMHLFINYTIRFAHSFYATHNYYTGSNNCSHTTSLVRARILINAFMPNSVSYSQHHTVNDESQMLSLWQYKHWLLNEWDSGICRIRSLSWRICLSISPAYPLIYSRESLIVPRLSIPLVTIRAQLAMRRSFVYVVGSY